MIEPLAILLVAALGLSVLLFFGSRASHIVELTTLALIPLTVALLVAESVVFIEFFGRTSWGWASARLASALSLLHGYDLYYRPGAGPLDPWIYGPVASLLWLPAAVMTTPLGAVRVGEAITAATVLGSVFWVHWRTIDHQPRGALRALTGFGFFCTLTCIVQPLPSWCFSLTVDGPAAAFAAGSIALLLNRDAQARGARVGSALLAALSVWTKQTMVPLMLALPLYEAWTYGKQAGLRYVLYLFLTGTAVSALFILAFGFEPLYFEMFALPASYPLVFSPRFIGGELLTSGGVMVVLLVIGATVDSALLRTQPPISWMAWLRSRPWVLALVVALFMLPMSVLSRMKEGSTPGSYISVFFLVLSVSLLLPRLAFHPIRASWLRVVRIALLGVALVSATLAARELWRLGRLTEEIPTSAFDDAFAFARAHPERVYFPSNPLIRLLADGRLDHFQAAVWYYQRARMAPDKKHFRAHLPEKPTWVVVPGRGRIPRRYLPEFDRWVELPELPGFTVYVRNEGGPARPLRSSETRAESLRSRK